MRVLVTGAGGFVGAQVVRQLVNEHHEVVAVGRNPDRLRRIAGDGKSVSTVTLDLGDADAVRELLRASAPDALIHLAWYANPSDYLTSRTNLSSLAMTASLVDAILQVGCKKLVLVGSCAEYAPCDRPVVESDPVDARTLYAACKHAAWQVARVMAAEARVELAWARIFHIHGPGEYEQRIIPWVARQIAAGIPVALTDGTQLRDHLHVSDVASALVAMLAPGVADIFNVCSGQPITLRSVLETVGNILGRQDLLQFGALPRRPNDTMYLVGDPGRLRALGWSPRFGLRDGLMDALRGNFRSSNQVHHE